MADNSESKQNTAKWATLIEDGKFYWGRKRELAVSITDGRISWGKASNVCDYPSEANVLDKVVYDNGNLLGILGKINEANPDIATQIKDRVESIMTDFLPEEYELMRYLITPSDNDFDHNAKQYGVLVENDVQTNSNLAHETIDVSFRIIMTNDYINDHDDLNQKLAAQELITQMELIRRRLRASAAGTFAKRTGPITNFERLDPQYSEEEDVIIQEATFSVEYTVSR